MYKFVKNALKTTIHPGPIKEVKNNGRIKRILLIKKKVKTKNLHLKLM